MASHIARTVRAASSAPRGHPANPAMPHTALRLRPGTGHQRFVPVAEALDDTTLMVLGAGVCLGRGAAIPSRTELGKASVTEHSTEMSNRWWRLNGGVRVPGN